MAVSARIGCLVALVAVLSVAAVGLARAQSAGKRLIVTIDLQADTTDPLLTVVSPSMRLTMENVCETLVGLDHEGHLAPTLATWIVSPDGTVIDFHLRPGVKFQSGAPLTAADVVFSHNRGMEKSANYRNSARGVSSAEAIDNLTARFVFSTPNVGFLTARNLFVGSKSHFDQAGEADYVAHPDCTGPYRLTEVKAGQYTDLDAFDGYWGGAPQFKAVRMAYVKEDSTRVAMLRSGESDINASTPWNQIATLRKEGFHFAQAETFPEVALNFQLYNPDTPWAKQPVREAIAHAIDGDAIVKGLLDGVPKRSPMVAPGEVGYDPSLKPYGFDPALSRKLLAQAGYPNGFTMPLYVPPTFYGMKETAEAVALYLKAVGITADVKLIDTAQNQQLLQKRAKDPTLEYTSLRAMPLANFGDPAMAMYFSLNKASAPAMYKAANPAFDDLLAQAATVFDDGKRADIVRRALKMVYDDVGIIALWDAVDVFAMKPAYSFTPIQHQPPLLHLIDVKSP